MNSIIPTLEAPQLSPQKAKLLPSAKYEANFASYIELRSHEIGDHDERFYDYYVRDVATHIGSAVRGFDMGEKARAAIRSGDCEPDSWEYLAASNKPWRVLSVIATFFGWKLYPHVLMVAAKRDATWYADKVKARIAAWLAEADVTYRMLIRQPANKLSRETWRGFVQHLINDANEIIEAVEFCKP